MRLRLRQSLPEILKSIQEAADNEPMDLKTLFLLLRGRGYAILFIFLSLPFCLPVQIPGFSTPFGLILAFLGLRFAFSRKLWWPKWILDKKISYETLTAMIEKTTAIMEKFKKVLHPRWRILFQHPLFYISHGLTIFILSLLLAIPLPVPFTNMIAAVPILFFGIAILENDGVVLILAYLLAVFAFFSFFLFFWIGKEGIKTLFLLINY